MKNILSHFIALIIGATLMAAWSLSSEQNSSSDNENQAERFIERIDKTSSVKNTRLQNTQHCDKQNTDLAIANKQIKSLQASEKQKEVLTQCSESEQVTQLSQEVEQLESLLSFYEESGERFPAHMDTPELRQMLVKEYLTLAQENQIIDNIVSTFSQDMLRNFPVELHDEVSAIINQYIEYDGAREKLHTGFAELYSAGDLNDLINFQKSANGRRLAEKQPEAMLRMCDAARAIVDNKHFDTMMHEIFALANKHRAYGPNIQPNSDN